MIVLFFCALTALSMAVQDTLGSSMIVAIQRKLRFWPGLFDGLGDFASGYGKAVTAAAVVKWGLGSWETFLLVTVTATTSFFTTNETTELAHRLLPKGDG